MFGARFSAGRMSISSSFIKRPVLTTVCSIVIVLAGLISLALLPLDKLPEMAPKQVSVTGTYIGADAKTTLNNVTTVLEREINGVDNMKWMNSNTTNSGISTINVSFPTEIDVNEAQVLVQNRVSQASSSLPSVVTQSGVSTSKRSSSTTLVLAFYSDQDEEGNYIYDTTYLNNYVDRYIWNEIRRLPGVGDLTLGGGGKYAMRIWVDQDALAARGLTASDVVRVIEEQNRDVGAGAVGKQPAPPDQQFELPLRIRGRFSTAEEAEDLIVKVSDNGTITRIGDIGRAELGQETYDLESEFNGDPAVALLIYQLPGTNAVETAQAVFDKMAELEASFPPGFNYAVANDNTIFIDASLQDLSITLMQSIGLVVLIIFVFLQDWRTTVIPAIAIPVALIGAMIAALALGFSLNQLTLFACVLATGLVVDDGIVVVEAVSSKLSQGMRPLQAALDAMQELQGATISTSIVLLAVFIPVSFFPGTTGIVYKQFALIIAAAITFSTFNALTFSPAMSAILLRPSQPVRGPLGLFFAGFNRLFGWISAGFKGLIIFLTHIRIVVIGLFIGGLILTAWIYTNTPQGFVPEEDQGYFLVLTEAPAGVSLNVTADLNRQVAQQIEDFPEIETTFWLAGFSFDGQNTNKGIFFVKLKDWNERQGAESSVFGLINRANQRFQQNITAGTVFAVNAPPVDGLSSTGGLELYIQDRRLLGIDPLVDNANRVVAAAQERPGVIAFTTFTSNSPMLELSIDRDRVKAQNVNIDELLSTVSTFMGSNFVNQFVLDGRLYRVYVQSDTTLRDNPEDIRNLYVRSNAGEVIPLGDLMDEDAITYPPILTNYNTYPAVKLQVIPLPGFSSGQAIAAMESIAAEVLQPGFGYEWTNTAAEEKSSGGAAPIIFGLAFVMVFLVLAAQYESYVDPTIIMLTVPLAILGALGAILFRAMVVQGFDSIWPILNNNIYAQVGLVMLIGMAAKNTILIVEFANQARATGMGITQAAIFAAEQRFRPILMTAFSTLLGFVPLLIASGAAAVSRWSLGTSVFGGMALSTVISLLFAPILYIVIKNFEQIILGGPPQTSLPPESPGNGATPIPRRRRPKVQAKPQEGLEQLPDIPQRAGSPAQSFKTSTQPES